MARISGISGTTIEPMASLLYVFSALSFIKRSVVMI